MKPKSLAGVTWQPPIPEGGPTSPPDVRTGTLSFRYATSPSTLIGKLALLDYAGNVLAEVEGFKATITTEEDPDA